MSQWEKLNAVRRRLAAEMDREKELAGELASAQAALAKREREVATSGAPFSGDPLSEELEVTKVGRHIRIQAERIRSIQEELALAQSAVDSASHNLTEAWAALRKEKMLEARARIRELGAGLRQACSDQIAWMAVGPGNVEGIGSPAVVHVEDADASGPDRLLVDSQRLLSGDWKRVVSEKQWGDIQLARSEVVAAVGGKSSGPL